MKDPSQFGASRYDHWRAKGVSPVRSDGSVATRENDAESAAAERFAVEALGCVFRDDLLDQGDGGADCHIWLRVKGVRVVASVQVKWTGRGRDGAPRRWGNLLVHPWELRRHAELYVVVSGGVAEGFQMRGWVTHHALAQRPLRDFGYGQDYNYPVYELWPMRELYRRMEDCGDYEGLELR